MKQKKGTVLVRPRPDGGVKKYNMKPFKINNNNVNPTCPTPPPPQKKNTYTPYPPQEKIPMA